jgi:hypothetical protein
MNFRDFLTLAESLAEESNEAAWRSAVRRAYYAAFHVAWDFLATLRFTVPKARSRVSLVEAQQQRSLRIHPARIASASSSPIVECARRRKTRLQAFRADGQLPPRGLSLYTTSNQGG